MKVSVVAAVAVPMATVVAMAVGAPTVQISVTVAVSMILRSGVMSVVAVVAMTQQRRMFLWLVVSVVAAVAETTHPRTAFRVDGSIRNSATQVRACFDKLSRQAGLDL